MIRRARPRIVEIVLVPDRFGYMLGRMSNDFPQRWKPSDRPGPLPPVGLPVQVQRDGCKSMAYLDKDGRWVDLFTHEPLPPGQRVIRT